MKQKLSQKLKMLSKADILTVCLFLAGFLFAVTDLNLLNLMCLTIKVLSQTSFVIFYLIAILFMFGMVRVVIKNINLFRVSKETLATKKVWPIFSSSFVVVCISYTIGFMVSLLNAFVIETFNRIAV